MARAFRIVRQRALVAGRSSREDYSTYAFGGCDAELDPKKMAERAAGPKPDGAIQERRGHQSRKAENVSEDRSYCE